MAGGGLLAAYLLGSVPFGYLVARARGVDIRAVGSGNIGATNVGRACGKALGALVFLLDAAKGFVAAGPLAWALLRLGLAPGDGLLAAGLGPLCAVAVFAGHAWPVFLGFRGGKGVATGAGAVAALAPISLAIGLGVWLVVLLVVRYMSLASMLGALATAGVRVGRSARAGELVRDWPLWGLVVLLALLVIVRHRANIGRLLRGEEHRLGRKRPAEAEKSA